MLLDVSFFAGHVPALLICSVDIIALKILMTLPAVRMLGYSLRTAIISAFCLAQVGEFSFVLAKSALELELITNDAYQIFLASSIATMVMTPLLIGAAPAAASLVLDKFLNMSAQSCYMSLGCSEVIIHDHALTRSDESLSQNVLARSPLMSRQAVLDAEDLFKFVTHAVE